MPFRTVSCFLHTTNIQCAGFHVYVYIYSISGYKLYILMKHNHLNVASWSFLHPFLPNPIFEYMQPSLGIFSCLGLIFSVMVPFFDQLILPFCSQPPFGFFPVTWCLFFHSFFPTCQILNSKNLPEKDGLIWNKTIIRRLCAHRGHSIPRLSR